MQAVRLIANITLCHGVKVGCRMCLFIPGAVIGSDGFGLANDQGTLGKNPPAG